MSVTVVLPSTTSPPLRSPLVRRPPVSRAEQLRASLLRVLSVSMVLALTFQSIPLPVNAQVSPLTSALGLIALPLLLGSERKLVLTPVAKVVLGFCGFVLFHSVVAVFVDVVILHEDNVRIVAWIRQLLSLAAGVSVFWVLRSTLRTLPDRTMVKLIVIGAIPPVFVALLNVLWGLGVGGAGNIVLAIRSVLAPLGFTYPYRASGLSLEPSHFGWYLSVLVLPISIVLLIRARSHRFWLLLFLLFCLLAFVWTFSGSGFAIAMIMTFAAARKIPARWLLMASFAVVVAAVLLMMIYPDNYFLLSVSELWNVLRRADLSRLNVSAMNAVYGTWGPFLMVDSSLTSIGYGLGGTSTHLRAMVPAVAYDAIRAVTWGEMPSLATLVGKLFAETGAVGLLLFLAIWIAAFHEIRIIRRAQRSSSSTVDLIAAARYALVGLLAGYVIKHGSFAVPFLWFWLAYIDSRFVNPQTMLA